jgi:hypothetical protein
MWYRRNAVPENPDERIDRAFQAHLYGIPIDMLNKMPWLEARQFCSFCNAITAFQDNICLACGWNRERTYRRNPSHVRLYVTGDYEEYRVEYYLDEEYREGPTYYAEEFDDALETAVAMKEEAEVKHGYSAEIDVDPELMGDYQDNPASYRRNALLSTSYGVKGHDRFMANHVPEITVKGYKAAAEIINGGHSHWPQYWDSGSCDGSCCTLFSATSNDLYHVTFKHRLDAILENGILIDQPAVWPEQTESGYIYAFKDVRDALRWAVKTSFEPDMPKDYAIIGFEADMDNWEGDPNQGIIAPGLNEGGWYRMDEGVEPEDFRMIIKYKG